MKNNLNIDFKTMTVVNENGVEILPVGMDRLGIQQAIENEFLHFAQITATARKFFKEVPSFTALCKAKYLDNKNDLGDYWERKVYSSYFILKHHPRMLNQMVQANILEKFYHIANAVNQNKRDLNYMELWDNLNNKYLVSELYQDLKNIS